MKSEHCLRAGAGTAVVEIGQEILPIEGFTSVRDPLHVRVLILESGIRTVIASVEITSLFRATQEAMLQRLCDLTGAARENVWLTLTHSFGGPHIWPAPEPGQTAQRGRRFLTEEEVLHCARLERAYLDALERAAQAALSGMRGAVIGAGRGCCTVNASRNIETRDGWWLGTDAEEPCDQSLTVLRVDAADGGPIALLYTYGVRSCVMKDSKGPDGGGIITSDLCGVTSMALEKEFGGALTALFLCGAAADQEPQLKSLQTEMDKDGGVRNIDQGAIGGALLDAQAVRLAAEVLKTWRRTRCRDVDGIRSGLRVCVCPTKKMAQTASFAGPVREAHFEADGEKKLTVYALRLGVLNLIGVQPEIDSVTSMQLAQAVEGELTAAVIQVNGGDKCMPERTAYEQVKYQCLNSPFQPGCAEITRDTAVELLRSL